MLKCVKKNLLTTPIYRTREFYFLLVSRSSQFFRQKLPTISPFTFAHSFPFRKLGSLEEHPMPTFLWKRLVLCRGSIHLSNSPRFLQDQFIQILAPLFGTIHFSSSLAFPRFDRSSRHILHFRSAFLRRQSRLLKHPQTLPIPNASRRYLSTPRLDLQRRKKRKIMRVSMIGKRKEGLNRLFILHAN